MPKALIVEILGDARQFAASLDQAAGKTRKFSTAVAGLGKLAAGAGIIALGIGLEKSVKAAEEAQIAQGKLDQALRNTHQSVEAMQPALEAAEAAGRKLGFTDDDQRVALAKLETATGDTTKSITELGLAQDIARLKGTDLDTATKLITGTLAGNTRAAKQLGIAIQPLTTHYDALKAKYKELGDAIPPAEAAQARFLDKQATAAATLQAVTDKVHGQAQAFSETAAGGMAEFHAQLQHLEEEIGTALLPGLTALVGKLNDLFEAVNSGEGTFAGLHDAFETIGKVDGPAATAAIEALKAAFTPLLAGMTAVSDLLHGNFKGALDETKTAVLAVLDPFHVFPAALNAVKNAADSVAKFFQGTLDGVLNATKGAVNALKSAVAAVESAFGAARSAAATVAGYLGGAFKTAVDAAKTPVAGFKSAIDAVTDSIHAVRNAASSVFSALAGIIKGAAKGAATSAAAIVSALSPVLSVLHAIQSAASAASSAIGALASAAGKIGGIASHIPGFASGVTNFGGGLAVVGEKGPELMYLPRGTSIFPASSPASSGALATAGGGGGTVVNVTVNGWVGNDQQIAERVRRELTRISQRNSGGLFS